VNKLMTGSIALGLLLAASSCSSDTKSSGTTVAAQTTIVAGSTTTAAATGTIDAVQTKVVAQTVAEAAEGGVTLDTPCLTAVVAKMSDADAQLILDAGPNGSPTLSAAGEALGKEAAACIVGGGTAETTPTT
jgi:hypothetical protein